MSFEQIKVELQEIMGSDRSIAECAWTSSTTHQAQANKTDEQVSELVKRLANDGHATPFESVVFRFWMRIPIFVDRQHMTHRIASHNGMSGRYRTMPDDWYGIPQDVLDIYTKVHPSEAEIVAIQYNKLSAAAFKFYKDELAAMKGAVSDGFITNEEYKRVREVLRGVCPQAAMTERVTTMNLRSFANYQALRNSEHAQPEIKDVAEKMLAEVKRAGCCPVAIEWLEKNGWKL